VWHQRQNNGGRRASSSCWQQLLPLIALAAALLFLRAHDQYDVVTNDIMDIKTWTVARCAAHILVATNLAALTDDGIVNRHRRSSVDVTSRHDRGIIMLHINAILT